jgi:hypothetical protein
MNKGEFRFLLKGVHNDTEIIFVSSQKNSQKHFEVEKITYIDDDLKEVSKKKAIFMQVTLKEA